MEIRKQLLIGFTILQLFVVILGSVSYWQAKQISEQTEILYNHPYQVRRAISNVRSDILNIHLAMSQLVLSEKKQQLLEALQLMETSHASVLRQFDVIDKLYMGPSTDRDEVYKAYFVWKTEMDYTSKLGLAGETEKAKNFIISQSAISANRLNLMDKIRKMDDFALAKGDALYNNSINLREALTRQLILLVAAILLFSLLINYTLIRSIRNPVRELTGAANRFHEGDVNARSAYESENEFGLLSSSFNALAESIQVKNDLDEKTASLAALMLSEYDVKKFFRATLHALGSYTGSQMVAIYLLSEDKISYEHFESIGVGENARQSFEAGSFDGEFGAAIASRQVQHIREVPEDTRFVFQTVTGRFIPREILTIPILADNEVIAIISMASISRYNEQSLRLIDKIFVTLCARVEGILSYHQIKAFLEKLESQNQELESQKDELFIQSAKLTEQNTELEMQKNQLNEANRLKTAFLSNMSHELRTPLNSVIALSGVLGRRLLRLIPEEEYGYLEVIERNGRQLLQLINNILDISRIEAGREEFEISDFNIGNLVSDLIEMIRPQAIQKKIELTFTGISSGLTLTSDPEKCRHILQNLIGNAIKFTETGSVNISFLQPDHSLEIIVTDTGIGISEDQLAHIFDEFRQADSSTSRRFGGTGLGLSIARKYALLLGGEIRVSSSPGKGSVFSLVLPRKYNGQVAENNAASFAGPGPWSGPKTGDSQPETDGKTILLVEDSEPAIIQLKDFLQVSGFSIRVARDGAEALEIIAGCIPDAMVLDLMMPGIDGFAVLKTIREEVRTAHIPVLILTAKHISREELSFLKRNNVHQLIQKGEINQADLLNAITAMVFPGPKGSPVAKPEPVYAEKPLVLVVEDHPDNMITVKALLSDEYRMLEATDGIAAIAMAGKFLPDLILMDIALPGMDGIRAFKSIRSNGRLQHIPVIALTASAFGAERETILSHGFEGYITKPIDEKLFFKSISEVLYGK